MPLITVLGSIFKGVNVTRALITALLRSSLVLAVVHIVL